uniref:Uncharacterized protein n=1 Tax=Cacopsylla melanoneura TaxID=428564 RepID=A0A8D9BSM4_9HEMI
MSTDDYQSYLQLYWKNILLGVILMGLLLFCCFYYCIGGRAKSSNHTDLFLINPSCTNSNMSSNSNGKSKKKDKLKSSSSSGFVVRGKPLVNTDDSDSSGSDEKCNKGYESYGHYRKGNNRDNNNRNREDYNRNREDNNRNREEEQCLLKPKCEEPHSYTDQRQYKKPKKHCDIYSYKGTYIKACVSLMEKNYLLAQP